jgi:hypothetical protein
MQCLKLEAHFSRRGPDDHTTVHTECPAHARMPCCATTDTMNDWMAARPLCGVCANAIEHLPAMRVSTSLVPAKKPGRRHISLEE